MSDSKREARNQGHHLNAGDSQGNLMDLVALGDAPKRFTGRARSPADVLRDPNDAETVDEMMLIADDLDGVFLQGEALVHAYGEEFTNETLETAEEGAKRAMSWFERRLYEAWKNGWTLPDLSNVQPRDVDGMTAAQLKKLDIYVRGLETLYPGTAFDRKFARGCRATIPGLINLIYAIHKVDKARLAVVGGRGDVSAQQYQELQAVNRLIASMGTAVTKYMTKARTMSRRFATLKAQALERRKRLAPEDGEIAALNHLPRMDPNFDLARVSGGGRVDPKAAVSQSLQYQRQREAAASAAPQPSHIGVYVNPNDPNGASSPIYQLDPKGLRVVETMEEETEAAREALAKEAVEDATVVEEAPPKKKKGKKKASTAEAQLEKTAKKARKAEKRARAKATLKKARQVRTFSRRRFKMLHRLVDHHVHVANPTST